MNSQVLHQEKTLATCIHLSVFSKYFFPFGNFLFPLLLWLVKKQDPFVDSHGRNAINFQISMFLYFILLVLSGLALLILMGVNLSTSAPLYIDSNHIHAKNVQDFIPLIIVAISIGTLILGLFLLEIYAVISASLRASEGELYKYPFCINFIKES
ncbi:DUF4870 domain-containing protein [Zunongwangia sp. H14]|uniref:DUF4870 domain-containing protein n=1 Tax=Zunongwangia sp. H14 TaxID=3240792 RepID=UPI003568DCB1